MNNHTLQGYACLLVAATLAAVIVAIMFKAFRNTKRAAAQ
jgi:hypothetical protein